jgi:hypothetical protein
MEIMNLKRKLVRFDSGSSSSTSSSGNGRYFGDCAIRRTSLALAF